MGFFKAYDMRGTFGVDFDLEKVRKIGAALPRVLPGKRWLVGRDCRLTGQNVKDSLVGGLLSSGVSVDDLGLCTTPMVYYFTAVGNYDASVMVTASHNPPGDNGLKVSKKTSLPVGYADGLDEVEKIVSSMGTSPACVAQVPPPEVLPGCVDKYAAWLLSKVDARSCEGLSFAVDCSNGMASILAEKLFPGAVIINNILDGSFPAHSPNPLKKDARDQISRLVKERSLDCGVIFDGDADRAMFVDENGDFVQPDYLTAILAKECSAARECSVRPKVLHDVRTSRAVIEYLAAEGFEPVMIPVGHAFAKPLMRSTSAVCGGELAGHYYFGDFFGCDSGALAALRILSAVASAKKRGLSFSELMRPLVSKYANSGEINYKVEDKASAIERVLRRAASLKDVVSRSDIDGVRLEFADGWINVRCSNTEPYLRLIAEFVDETDLKNMLDALEKEIVVGGSGG